MHIDPQVIPQEEVLGRLAHHLVNSSHHTLDEEAVEATLQSATPLIKFDATVPPRAVEYMLCPFVGLAVLSQTSRQSRPAVYERRSLVGESKVRVLL